MPRCTEFLFPATRWLGTTNFKQCGFPFRNVATSTPASAYAKWLKYVKHCITAPSCMANIRMCSRMCDDGTDVFHRSCCIRQTEPLPFTRTLACRFHRFPRSGAGLVMPCLLHNMSPVVALPLPNYDAVLTNRCRMGRQIAQSPGSWSTQPGMLPWTTLLFHTHGYRPALGMSWGATRLGTLTRCRRWTNIGAHGAT